MSKKIIQEGKATLEVDTAEVVSKDLEVFYNPDMIPNRDISIALLKTISEKPLCIALPLAGSGVRGVRMLLEMPEIIKKIEMNDASSQATTLIKENLQRNDIETDEEKICIHQKDASLFLEESIGFDYIDIDPFGSPNQFLDTAIRKLSRKGILAVTATDTSSLAGTYPTTCKRKYWSKSAITPLKHEVGMRILMRKVILLGIHHNKALLPILSYHDKHYYRIFFKSVKSKEQAVALYDEVQSYIIYHKDSAKYEVTTQVPQDNPNTIWCGPLYSGAMKDNKVLEEVLKVYDHKLLKQMFEEIDTVGSYDTHQIAQKNNLLLVSLEKLIEELKNKNYEASRSATNLHAIKTTASFEVVVEVMKQLQP